MSSIPIESKLCTPKWLPVGQSNGNRSTAVSECVWLRQYKVVVQISVSAVAVTRLWPSRVLLPSMILGDRDDIASSALCVCKGTANGEVVEVSRERSKVRFSLS